MPKPKSKPLTQEENPFFPCPACGYQCFRWELVCFRCQNRLTPETLQTARRRENKTYEDILKDNAKRAGKDPLEALRRSRMASRIGIMDPMTSKETNRKMAAWLKKRRGENQIFNGRRHK